MIKEEIIKLKGADPFVHLGVISMLLKHKISCHRYLDLGCYDGKFTIIVAKIVGAKEIYGVDIDSRLLSKAPALMRTAKVDLLSDKLSYPDEYFDLITAIEVIEHLAYSDNLILESFRVLKSGGYLLISTPNLASRINRLLILLGYQPTLVGQISKYFIVGLPKPIRRRSIYAGHVSAYTLYALTSILTLYGFIVIDKMGVTANYSNKLLRVLEKLLPPSLSSFIIVLAKKL